MTLPTSITNTSQSVPFSIIAKKHRDGSVLLSAANDRVYKLNGVGAITWTVLEQSATPLTLNEVVGELYFQLENVSAGGELRYEVTPEQLQTDTIRFINSLADAGLLQILHDSDGPETYQIKRDISSTTSTTVAQ